MVDLFVFDLAVVGLVDVADLLDRLAPTRSGSLTSVSGARFCLEDPLFLDLDPITKSFFELCFVEARDPELPDIELDIEGFTLVGLRVG